MIEEEELDKEYKNNSEKFNYSNDHDFINEKKARNQKIGKNIQKSEHHGKEAREKGKNRNHNIKNNAEKITNRK